MSMSQTEVTTTPCRSVRTGSTENHREDPEAKHAERMQASMDVGFLLQRVLSSDLAPSVMNGNRVRLETLRRCSYYLEVTRLDVPLGDSYLSNSTIMHLIDPWKLQRAKKQANSVVKIQLCLLEELLEQLLKERQSLEAMLACCDLPMLMQQGDAIRERLSAALQTKAEFDAIGLPAQLRCKHKLISDMGEAHVPQLRLALMPKLPVYFDKAQSFATYSSATLQWHVAGSEAAAVPREQFELRYKLMQPSCAVEGTEVGVLTCAACTAKVEGLRPDRCYEFTIKRVDSCCLVYALWIDTIILRTTSTSVGGGNENRDKRRRLFPW